MREVEFEDAENRCHRIVIDVPPVAVYRGPRDGTTGLTLPGHRKVVVAGEVREVMGKIAATLGDAVTRPAAGAAAPHSGVAAP